MRDGSRGPTKTIHPKPRNERETQVKTIDNPRHETTGQRLLRRGAAVAVAVVAAGTLAACSSDSTGDEVSVSDPWVRVTPGGKDMTAAYMNLESPVDDELVGASVAGDIAETAELHETTGSHSEGMDGMEMGDQMGPGKGNMADSDDMSEGMDGMESGSEGMSGMDNQMEMMGMKEVPSIALPAGEEVKLEPGGYHIMLIGLKGPIESGDDYLITLEFEKAGEIDVQAIARDN